MAIGVFNDFPEQFAGTSCKIITGMKGPEDLEVDALDNLIFVSALNRRAPKKTPDPQDGLYTLKLDNTSAPPVKLAGTPRDFHPHGISLYRDLDGSLTLFAVNHKSTGKEAVEIFGVTIENGAAKLTHRSSIEGGLLVSPNDVFAVAPERFYVTNDHTSTTPLGLWLENYPQLPRANLIYFNGMGFRVAVQRLNFPNGVLVSPDGKFLYVTSTVKREILAFERNPFTGDLTQTDGLRIPARLDNLSMDAFGNLWTAGHPKLPLYVGYPSDPTKPSPSVVFRISMKDGVPQSYDTVYANNGGQLAASSAAVSYQNRLFIGSVLDNKMLDCAMR
jgi:arylesterase/paraoxonase